MANLYISCCSDNGIKRQGNRITYTYDSALMWSGSFYTTFNPEIQFLVATLLYRLSMLHGDGDVMHNYSYNYMYLYNGDHHLHNIGFHITYIHVLSYFEI